MCYNKWLYLCGCPDKKECLPSGLRLRLNLQWQRSRQDSCGPQRQCDRHNWVPNGQIRSFLLTWKDLGWVFFFCFTQIWKGISVLDCLFPSEVLDPGCRQVLITSVWERTCPPFLFVQIQTLNCVEYFLMNDSEFHVSCKLKFAYGLKLNYSQQMNSVSNHFQFHFSENSVSKQQFKSSFWYVSVQTTDCSSGRQRCCRRRNVMFLQSHAYLFTYVVHWFKDN